MRVTSYDDAAPLVAAPRRAHHRLMQTQSSAVETSRKERLVLVRVPAFVAEHWKVASEGDAPLGVVQPQGAPDAAGRQKYSVRLDKHAEYPASYPHEFELTCAAPAEPLYAFSRPTGKSGARSRLEGRVALRGDVKPAPHLKNEYKQVVRDREAKHSGGNKRAIGVVDSVQTEAHVQLQAKGARVDKEAKREARMERGPKVQQYDPNMPEADLKALVLDKFETGAEGGGERRYWSKKELAEVTRQRPAHLGVALEELCDYVKTGSMKGTYELNKRYSSRKS